MPSSMHYTPQTSSNSRPSRASSRGPGPRASQKSDNHSNEDESMRASVERPTRGHSRDSAYSRSDTTMRGGSHDRLSSPPQAASSSRASRMAKLPSFDRLVCAAVARLKGRKGSSIRDIAKNVKSKYAAAPSALLKGSSAKISSAARRLVREGKLVRVGNQFKLGPSKGGGGWFGGWFGRGSNKGQSSNSGQGSGGGGNKSGNKETGTK
ncbi:hypothetical protein AXG93_3217s1790 [Marchantia polymorpha subsp. ruderalis]|uniref:H15 domain-containing protein n=1 Tax=Marchantia polymorpha subsp. ruderalis TaxID=1480154 RepID=A0A176VXT5_MARPO|nr:hypothetical protein AXG93_3217s1790 [Marchantia polymorpha subsp. ruderalis]